MAAAVDGDSQHCITLYETAHGGWCWCRKSAGKKNEQRSVLDTLDVKGAYITLDAMSSQKKGVKKIIDRDGDHTVNTKNNYKRLRIYS